MANGFDPVAVDLVVRWLESAGFSSQAHEVATAAASALSDERAAHLRTFSAAVDKKDYVEALDHISAAFPTHRRLVAAAVVRAHIASIWHFDSNNASDEVYEVIKSAVDDGLLLSEQAAVLAPGVFEPPEEPDAAAAALHALMARLAIELPDTVESDRTLRSLDELLADVRRRAAAAAAEPAPLPARCAATGFGHTQTVRALDTFVLRDVMYAVSGSRDGLLRLWRVAGETLDAVAETALGARVWNVAAQVSGDDARVVATASGRTVACFAVNFSDLSFDQVWRIQLPGAPGADDVFAACFYGRCANIIGVGDSAGRVTALDVDSGELRGVQRVAAPVHGLAPGPRDTTLAATGDGSLCVLDRTGGLLWRVSTFAPLFDVAAAPDSRRCAVVGADGRLRVLSALPRPAPAGPRSAAFGALRTHCVRAAWRPDGSSAAVGTEDGAVAIVDTETGETQAMLAAGEAGEAVLAVAWAGRSKLLTGGLDGVIRLFVSQ